MNIAAKMESARQCRDQFANWPAILLRLGFSHLGWNRGTFTVSSRTGVTVHAPNQAESRWPPIEILAEDCYGLRTLTWSNPLSTRVVLDIGAHVGSFTCALAAHLPGATFVCVEPLPSIVVWLRANLNLNGLTHKATVMVGAVAATEGEAELWVSDDGSSEASLDPDLWAYWHPYAIGQTITVRTVNLDSIVGTASGPAIVKLDCEGGEYPAILESSPETWATVEQLFLEYHPVAGHDFRELRDRLNELDLHLIWQHPSTRTGMGIAYFERR